MNKLRPILLVLTSVAALSVAFPARAFTITMVQSGGNVVATGTGAINLTGLTSAGPGSGVSFVQPNFGSISFGGVFDTYTGFTGPSSFGSGFFKVPDDVNGSSVRMFGFAGLMGVPHGYVSGTALSDSMTFNNATFASLGVTPGTYEWTWGVGRAVDQFLILQIGPAGVPDGGSTVSLLGFGLLGLAALRRRLRC